MIPAPSRRAVVAGIGAMALGAATVQPLRPRRIVSLNPCLDVILVRVADRTQIAALSHYASDPHGSTIAAIARSLPKTFGSAEEVVAMRPDLVLAARYTAPATQRALARLGVPVALFDVPETIADSVAQVREIARLAGQSERGARAIARIGAALRAAAPPRGARSVSTLVFMPGGFASGPGTLMDELMRRAGLANAALRYGLTQSRNIPLEQLIADPPELLLSGEPTPGVPGWAQRVMSHPALARIAPQMHRAPFPERLLFCGGPVMIESLAALARARRTVAGG